MGNWGSARSKTRGDSWPLWFVQNRAMKIFVVFNVCRDRSRSSSLVSERKIKYITESYSTASWRRETTPLLWALYYWDPMEFFKGSSSYQLHLTYLYFWNLRSLKFASLPHCFGTQCFESKPLSLFYELISPSISRAKRIPYCKQSFSCVRPWTNRHSVNETDIIIIDKGLSMPPVFMVTIDQ